RRNGSLQANSERARDHDSRRQDRHPRSGRDGDHGPVHRRHHREAVTAPPPAADTVTTLFHCSDLHFGHPAVPEQYEAIEALIQDRKYDVVAISGDVSQRARSGEFQRAREFIRKAETVAETIVVPGNHDVAWWLAPLGFGDQKRIYAKYRAYISQDLEP